MLDILLDFWGVIVTLVSAFLGLAAWALRLEAKIVANAKETNRLWKVREEDKVEAAEHHKAADKKLDTIHADVRELNRDIKRLLERT